MSSSKPLKLPVINFSGEDLHPGSSSWISTQVEVRNALVEYGCFEAIYDDIPLEAHNDMYSSLEELFNLPVETKRKNVNESIPDYGYIGQNPHIPLYEGIGFNDADVIDTVQNFTSLMWPQGNPKFCETIHSYVNRLTKLEHIVKKIVYESFDLQRYPISSMENTEYLFRAMIYRPQKNETNGLGAHTDKTFVTILHQNQVNGLEIETKDGEYLSVNPGPKSFTVMIGDSFMAWSNGRLRSCRHRVVLKEDKTRYSFGLFSFNKGNVEAPVELVDEQHPLLYKPFHHLDFIRFYMSQRGKTEKCTLSDYCGTGV